MSGATDDVMPTRLASESDNKNDEEGTRHFVMTDVSILPPIPLRLSTESVTKTSEELVAARGRSHCSLHPVSCIRKPGLVRRRGRFSLFRDLPST